MLLVTNIVCITDDLSKVWQNIPGMITRGGQGPTLCHYYCINLHTDPNTIRTEGTRQRKIEYIFEFSTISIVVMLGVRSFVLFQTLNNLYNETEKLLRLFKRCTSIYYLRIHIIQNIPSEMNLDLSCLEGRSTRWFLSILY